MLTGLAAALVVCAGSEGAPPVSVACLSQTAPLTVAGDAADDAAVWVHPSDPALSLIIGTNKQSGLLVYDLEGRALQIIDGARPNNVDIAPGGDGKDGVIFASDRSDNSIAIYRVDAASRRVERDTGASIATGLDEVYGLCVYTDPASSKVMVVAGSKRGLVRVFEQRDTKFEQVREFCVGGQIEGMVADPQRGWLYIGEEQVGLWQYPIDPAKEPSRRLIDAVGGAGAGLGGNLAPDVEGVTLYDAGNGKGWIIVSCQGENRFAVYDRETLTYKGSFGLHLPRTEGANDEVTHTDGIAALSTPLGSRFPAGIFIAQDDNDGTNQCFKIADWRAVHAALFSTP
jgi:3-phytase